MDKKKNTKKGGHIMAVSMAVVPLLKNEVADSFFNTLNKSKLKPYTDKERKETDRKIAEIIAKRQK